MMRTTFTNWAVVGRLRRTLLVLVFITSGAALLLYWKQQSDDIEFQQPRSDNLIDGASKWSWTCKEDRCERNLAREGVQPQSLATCSMLCGGVKIWPHPTGAVKLSSIYIPVSPEIFSLEVVKYNGMKVKHHLIEAFELFRADLKTYESFASGPSLALAVKEVKVKVSLNGSVVDPKLTLKTNESYDLVMSPKDDVIIVNIFAQSFCGARHAFETLSQLIWMDPYAGGGGLVMFEAASVKDAPSFHYRSLLLDTARNFFPVQDLLRTIDAMGAAKLNTFHWHATDSQSFPIKFKSVPSLYEYGAYGSGAVYTVEDIKTVVKRARLRGVRVIIEVDAPAHVGRAWSFGPEAGLGDLALCVESEPWMHYCGEPPCGQLNPTNNNVYDILEKLYTEIIELTGVRDVFHLGGDEVFEECWKSYFNETVDTMDLWTSFTYKAIERLKKANNGVLPELNLLWSSKMTVPPYLSRFNNTFMGVQTWGASTWPESRAPIEAGFRTIISHVDAWYLDCGFGSWRDSGDGHCGPFRTWQRVWSHRPWYADKTSIIGGAACQWSEQLDANEMDARMWPRAAALGERLWTDPIQTEPAGDVYWRLDHWVSRANLRGLRPAPLWPRWCQENPLACL